MRAAVVGPAGKGKSYLLKGLIELVKSKGLVVTKLAPSGVDKQKWYVHHGLTMWYTCDSYMQVSEKVRKLR